MCFSNLEPKSLYICPRIITNVSVLLNMKAMMANCRYLYIFPRVYVYIYKKNSEQSLLYVCLNFFSPSPQAGTATLKYIKQV